MKHPFPALATRAMAGFALGLAAQAAFAVLPLSPPELVGGDNPALPERTSEGNSAGRPAEKSGEWTRFGVVVASRSGLKGDKPLQYAYADGLRLEKLLRGLGQMDAGHVTLLRTESAAELRAQLDILGSRIAAQRERGRKVMLQFYYTGHGGGRSFHIGGEQVSFGEVKASLEKGRPEARIYVLDVCQGASFFASKGFNTTKPVRVAIDLDKSTKGEVTISSSAHEEQAYEVKTLGGSIFTSHWEMALRGAGDRNRDGQVTLFEAYNYAYDQTVAFSRETLNLPQHPSFSIDLTGAKDLLLTRPGSDQGGLLFRNLPVGVYSLLDVKRGAPVGEMRIPETGDYSLALEPGSYRVDHAPAQGPAVSAQVEVAGHALIPLRAEHFAKRPRGFALGKGNLQETWPAGEGGQGSGSGPGFGDGGFGPGGQGRSFAFGPALVPSRWEWVSWGGLSASGWGFSRSAFAPMPSVAQTYGLAGGYAKPGYGLVFGFQTLKQGTVNPFASLLGGFHFALEKAHLDYRAQGKESLPEIPPEQSPGVVLKTRIERTAIQFGPMVSTPVLAWKKLFVSGDMSLGALRHALRVKTAFASEAFGLSQTEEALEGWGFALEGHAVPGFAFRLPATQEWMRMGFRLGGGYHHLGSLTNRSSELDMQGLWVGRAALQVSLCGGRPW